MNAIFLQTLHRLRGQILGWGGVLLLLGMGIVSLYETVAKNGAQIEQLIKNYPPEMLAFFGDVTAISTPAGFLAAEFFSYMPIILGVFAVLVGSGLLASDEEAGTLELVLTHPISRNAVFWGRVLGFAVAVIGVLVLAWLGCLLATIWSSLGVDAGTLLLPFVSLGAVLLLFGGLALMFSMTLPSRRLAAMLGGLVVIASFFLSALARISDNLATLAKVSPLNYYQSGDALNGLRFGWLAGLLAVAAFCAIVAWQRFVRRDIRVAGEGGWRLPVLRRRAV